MKQGKKVNTSYIYFIFFILLINLISSCIAPKKAKYFNNISDTISTPQYITNVTQYIEPKIESNDILAITIQTIEQNSTNTPITSNSVAAFNPLNGFLVDKNGYIELSLIGFVKVGGLTTSEAREIIKQKAREYYKEPVVNCRIANFDIMVLGDVAKPGVVNFPNEKATIIDALGGSGDINLTARKDNILLIRTENQEKKMVRINLNSSKIFQSPYFYLKQRDVLVIEPRNSKIRDSDNRFTKYLGIVTAIVSLSTLLLAYSGIKK